MDRTIVIAASAPIPHGHRIEVVERVDDTGERAVMMVIDLETRVKYQQGTPSASDAVAWTGRVLECTIVSAKGRGSTTLLVDPIGPGSSEADVALRGADAAAFAAKAEADRWGGADRVPEPKAPRFW
ncbi:hypothetical protein DC31_11040 [Microbacterium sp. CH12i]|uniref:hypothetical protein n=1 Tax=Microbacterium sp. CH12i TaxID=1479651 RepID=UPI000461F94F|nr:hypothetical protein [Microbacterium sp. CH12i]KDA06359.1 hypothetical protein DC31_11040 [Microbacterium sp. CH12i]